MQSRQDRDLFDYAYLKDGDIVPVLPGIKINFNKHDGTYFLDDSTQVFPCLAIKYFDIALEDAKKTLGVKTNRELYGAIYRERLEQYLLANGFSKETYDILALGFNRHRGSGENKQNFIERLQVYINSGLHVPLREYSPHMKANLTQGTAIKSSVAQGSMKLESMIGRRKRDKGSQDQISIRPKRKNIANEPENSRPSSKHKVNEASCESLVNSQIIELPAIDFEQPYTGQENSIQQLYDASCQVNAYQPFAMQPYAMPPFAMQPYAMPPFAMPPFAMPPFAIPYGYQVTHDYSMINMSEPTAYYNQRVPAYDEMYYAATTQPQFLPAPVSNHSLETNMVNLTQTTGTFFYSNPRTNTNTNKAKTNDSQNRLDIHDDDINPSVTTPAELPTEEAGFILTSGELEELKQLFEKQAETNLKT